jgi:AcrR family transcriptional regulator
MSRTVNEERPEELLTAILKYLLQHGLSDLSLRPLAKAVGSSPRVLLYYFGSKEKMITEILAILRERQRALYAGPEPEDFSEGCHATWKHMTSPRSEQLFRLYFEAYGVALRHPQLYSDFLHSTVEDWLKTLAVPLTPATNRADARALATVLLAGFRGFMLDFCTTRDRKRLNRSVSLWIRAMAPLWPVSKETSRAPN